LLVHAAGTQGHQPRRHARLGGTVIHHASDFTSDLKLLATHDDDNDETRRES